MILILDLIIVYHRVWHYQKLFFLLINNPQLRIFRFILIYDNVRGSFKAPINNKD